MPAYVIARYDITDAEGYEAYGPAAGSSVAQYGGEVLGADRAAVALEGEQPDNIVVLRFDSVDAARSWYESDEYQAALPHRTKHTTNGEVVIVEGFDSNP